MIKKAKRVKKICPTCGKEFEILKSRLKWGGTFCSQECQRNRKKNKITKRCVVCGKFYQIWPYEIFIRVPTCSKKCTKFYLRQKYKKKVICPVCKKMFWTSKKNPLKHCSMECRNKFYIGKNMTGNFHVCSTCGKKFYVTKSRLKRKEGIYCSRECRDNAPNKSIEQRIREGGLVELECAWCGKKFIRSRCFKDIQRYCSSECARKSKNETAIETKTRKALEKFTVYFEQEKTIKKADGKGCYFIDFFLPPNIIIECDGKFWHNPEMFPSTYKKNVFKRRYLRKRGYKIYILKEIEINEDVNKLVKNILKENPNIEINNKTKKLKTKPRKRTIMVKLCKFCGQEFETIPSRAEVQNFCNKKCRANFYNMELKCQNCGKAFLIKRYKQKRKFCSMACQKEFTKKKNRVVCSNCGGYFSPNPADRKRGKAKFCSKKCLLENKNKKINLEKEKIVNGLKKGIATKKYLRKNTNLTLSILEKRLKTLVDEDIIFKKSRGVYSLN